MNKTLIFILAILVGILIGGLVGELLAYFLPTSVVRTFFMKSIDFGFETITLNLVIIKLTFGLTFKFNFISLILVVLTVYYFKWWLL
ncbi:DUF4321 domain-containing protein [bacterium]|nr:DUF4321 domain-containing protein [bacterium]